MEGDVNRGREKKILIAKYSGFCMGVERAIRIAMQKASSDSPLYIYGDLIHNPPTIHKLAEHNVFIEHNLDRLVGKRVAIRTHGIPKKEKKYLYELSGELIDLTCPRVKRVHKIIMIYINKGYSVVIVGKKKHPEVIGHLGYTENNGIVVENGITDEIRDWIAKKDKLLIIAQTTVSPKLFSEVVEKIKAIKKDIAVHNTICETTIERQEEIRKMKGEIDFLIVVGGKNSSNTRNLYELARSIGIPSLHIENKDEIDVDLLASYDRIGITAGASTPKWIVNEIADYLRRIFLCGKESYKRDC
jgi:4-hydroxy-3-methylbut-2-enyl diphosphate reductase